MFAKFRKGLTTILYQDDRQYDVNYDVNSRCIFPKIYIQVSQKMCTKNIEMEEDLLCVL